MTMEEGLPVPIMTVPVLVGVASRQAQAVAGVSKSGLHSKFVVPKIERRTVLVPALMQIGEPSPKKVSVVPIALPG